MLISSYFTQPRPNQCIPNTQMMIKKTERMIISNSCKPKRKFRQFNSQRIQINPINAQLSNSTFPVCHISLMYPLQTHTQLYKKTSNILYHLNEKMTTSHRRIKHIDSKYFLYSLKVVPCLLNCIT